MSIAKLKQDKRELTLTEVILLHNHYKDELDRIGDKFSEKNNNHRVIENRYNALKMELLNRSNQLEWDI